MVISEDDGAVARSLVLDDIDPWLPASGMVPITRCVGQVPNFKDLEKTEEYQRQVCAGWGELNDEASMHLILHSLRRHDDGGLTCHHTTRKLVTHCAPMVLCTTLHRGSGGGVSNARH